MDSSSPAIAPLPLRVLGLCPGGRARKQQPLWPILVAHGRAGGAIPATLAAFCDQLAEAHPCSHRHCSSLDSLPLVLLTRSQPLTDQLLPHVLEARRHDCRPLLLPMFALPGQHVIHDLAQACRWLADASHGLQRLPFLGSWPGLQRQLQEVSNCLRAVGQRPVLLSHPSCHPLTCRFVGMLGRRLGLSVQQPELERLPLLMDRLDSRDVVIPYQVAENRYSDRLAALLAGHESGPQLLDPLLSWPSVRALVGQHLARIQ